MSDVALDDYFFIDLCKTMEDYRLEIYNELDDANDLLPIGFAIKKEDRYSKTPLPKTNGPNEITGAKTFEGTKEKMNNLARKSLEFLSDSEREKVLQAAQEIKMRFR